MKLKALLFDFFFPQICVGCGDLGSYLCGSCQAKIKYFNFPLCPACGQNISTLGVHTHCHGQTSLDGLIALAPHENPLKQLIQHLKYYGHFDMIATVTQVLVMHAKNLLPSPSLVTGVPMYPAKARQRGYNQSELLAREFARQAHFPYQTLLKKTKATPSQAGLKRAARLANLHEVFEATQNHLDIPTVILVDDVTTTRTTLNECAKALKKAGVCRVFGLVLAHGK